ncbi:hypothetical protein EDD21DRAFT_447816 [Dissophora ornata]|nr:hypothetical protein EDD21DRAFT_447816 [Dissophora ornata]
MVKTTPKRRARVLKGKEVAREGISATTPGLPSLSEYKAQKEAMRMFHLSQPSQSSQSTQPESHGLPSLAVYKAQKDAQRESDIANKMAEAATLQRTTEARQTMLSTNTINQYLRYERHWVAWCQRRQYPDTCVVPERALRYMEENTAEHPDPEKGIEPLRVRADPRVKNKRGPVKMVPPSAQTVDMYIKCLVNLYHQQCADPSFPSMTLQSYPNPRKYLAVVKDVYENRLNRVKASEDIGSIGLVQGNTSASLRQLMRAAWGKHQESETSRSVLA